MSLIKYTVRHTDLVEHNGERTSAFEEVVYIARGVDARIAELEKALLDGIEWADECTPKDVFDRMKKAAGL